MSSTEPLSVIFVPFASPSAIITAGSVLPALGIITVLLRFYVRTSRKQQLTIDDWLVLPALLFVIGMGASLIASVKKHGWGYPTPVPAGNSMEDFLKDINPQIVVTKQTEYATALLMILAYGFIKLSILFFYRRLFAVGKTTFSMSTWVMIGITISWMITFFFIHALGCGKKPSAYWGSRNDIITYCGKGLLYEEGLYISEFILNIMLLIMPLPMIWKLHMPTNRKFAVTGILLLAFMAVIASIIRLAIVLQVTQTSYTTPFDENETIGTIYYWGMIEAGIALIACTLPSLKPLFTQQGIQSAIHSVRSAISLRSVGNSSTNRSLDAPSSGSAGRSYNKIEAGAPDLTPLRVDNVMEMENNIGFSKGSMKTNEQGTIMVQRDLTMHDNRG